MEFLGTLRVQLLAARPVGCFTERPPGAQGYQYSFFTSMVNVADPVFPA